MRYFYWLRCTCREWIWRIEIALISMSARGQSTYFTINLPARWSCSLLPYNKFDALLHSLREWRRKTSPVRFWLWDDENGMYNHCDTIRAWLCRQIDRIERCEGIFVGCLSFSWCVVGFACSEPVGLGVTALRASCNRTRLRRGSCARRTHGGNQKQRSKKKTALSDGKSHPIGKFYRQRFT